MGSEKLRDISENRAGGGAARASQHFDQGSGSGPCAAMDGAAWAYLTAKRQSVHGKDLIYGLPLFVICNRNDDGEQSAASIG
jgi:hypothetical protein